MMLVHLKVPCYRALTLLPSATKLGQGYIFTGICDSVHGGMHGCRGGACMVRGCMVVGGVHGSGGHAWLRGACMVAGGMHGCRGACVAVGGACMVAGGCAWLWGVCMVAGGACMGYDEIRSMSERYASY